ncbi:MAG: NADP oxidoreductase [Bacteroidetes bacterium]|nr:MAG: NADP oxidoreductase [Bacteroidota bacterium]
MDKTISFSIDDKEYTSTEGKYIIEAARENGVYIPTLCNYDGVKPAGSCRICTVKVNKRYLTACTTPVAEGMEIEVETEDLLDLRKAVVELLFTEGNHFCPSCEKSGNCELQALAYKFQIMVPRFPFQFNESYIDASNPKIYHDHNRCILCKRCIRVVKDENGKSIFAFENRAREVRINFDRKLGNLLTDELAEKAMEVCPVGSILVKEKGFEEPIGTRKFDHIPIDQVVISKK